MVEIEITICNAFWTGLKKNAHPLFTIHQDSRCSHHHHTDTNPTTLEVNPNCFIASLQCESME